MADSKILVNFLILNIDIKNEATKLHQESGNYQSIAEAPFATSQSFALLK